jgi:hypothetical protein
VFRHNHDLCYYAGQLKNHVFRHIHDICYYAGQLKNYVLIPGRVKRFFTSLKHPHWLWGPYTFLSKVYGTIFCAL